MNFYQQNYFQPYSKISKSHYPNNYNRSPHKGYSRQDPYYDSPSPDKSYKRAPIFERSPIKNQFQTRITTEPVWEHLYREGRKSKQDLLEKHNQNKNRLDIQCTFKPILHQNKRYMVHSGSSFIDRMNNWNQQKIEKKVKEKEEQIYDDLKECTFTPKINQRPRRPGPTEGHPYYGQKSYLRMQKSQKQLRQLNRNINPYYSPIKGEKKKTTLSPSPIKYGGSASKVEVGSAMKIIKNELKRLAI